MIRIRNGYTKFSNMKFICTNWSRQQFTVGESEKYRPD